MGSPVLRIPTFFSTVRSVCVAASDNVLATLRRSSPTSSGAILFFTMSLQQSHKINDRSHALLLQSLAMMIVLRQPSILTGTCTKSWHDASSTQTCKEPGLDWPDNICFRLEGPCGVKKKTRH